MTPELKEKKSFEQGYSSIPLIQVKNVKKYFTVGNKKLKAVDGLYLDIYQGETVGLVGESGCGKSTAGRTIIRLYEPTSGAVLFNGKNIFQSNDREMSQMRREMQMIFQDPYASLNPRMTVEEVIGEPFAIHGVLSGKKRRERVKELLRLVGLDADHISRFPHEFSGGQRQRIGIARALALDPTFIVCDEPISALDVSIQAQVVNLLKDLQRKMGLTYLFIAHDLSMVKYISDRILVMYLGKMFELADSEKLYEDPLHPYTKALLSSVPIPDPEVKRERIILKGDVPSPIDPPSGCVFRTRCPVAMDVCAKVDPDWKEVKPGHFTACHLYQ
ncbi:oligopeptide/dipeptide ABC transporter ATP-binding protein [Siminovitchia sp. FSL H7-0308]|uniref:Peptide/nickel transport system ATP-binding protein/oligopeptide transport system ATP-binding protein n=1 Tax=Siminovitchia thermophila TaxID=1245522 RepID=A0ABS2R0A7_9BACI|nr:oligopeptide/dipeptide ABC transporter ATP-binding protein [Siminovitchia thermophila]MBM7713076.1 peptide/nickel transport system ATP-binding protein/oligopeptide transport system ATP-binding protein [Siminovitchia thermophila]ONK24884.1 oligopeptide ABC transporter ATP-binding protein OppF [Bacillus sp. VT-16-64]